MIEPQRFTLCLNYRSRHKTGSIQRLYFSDTAPANFIARFVDLLVLRVNPRDLSKMQYFVSLGSCILSPHGSDINSMFLKSKEAAECTHF